MKDTSLPGHRALIRVDPQDGGRRTPAGDTVELRPSGTQRETPTQDPYPPGVELGRVLRERYVLELEVGSGGIGTVFKALDLYRAHLPKAAQYVAVKILKPADTLPAENREALLAKLKREFYCTQALSHPNIVKAFELDRDGDIDFFTMEYLDGEQLGSILTRLRGQTLFRRDAWAIIRAIGAALEHAHARNIIHADLKPQNVMVTHTGEVRVIDFGASSNSVWDGLATLQTENPRIQVTPAYASCEMLAGRAADSCDDVYSFACLAYELLAGEHPFQRRPSTDARNLAIVPKRPPGLTWRQWHTLHTGLCWHRAGRSMPVHAWTQRLIPKRTMEWPIPSAGKVGLRPESKRPRPLRPIATMCTLLLASAFLGLMVIGFPLHGKAGGGVASATTEAPTHRVAGATPASNSAAPSNPTALSPSAAPTVEKEIPQTGGVRGGAPSDPATTADSPVIAPSEWKILPGDHFAEIRVHRSSASRNTRAFTWWTEAASAKPGVDYVSQAKVTQFFPKGKMSTSFFIKLVPKASRTKSEMFYIAIADIRHGSSSGGVERASIWLPSNRDRT